MVGFVPVWDGPGWVVMSLATTRTELRRGQTPLLTMERGLDVILSLVGVAALLPLMVAIAAVVWLSGSGSPFYAQSRIGCGGRSFRCWKFRTMQVDAEQRLEGLLATSRAARIEWEREHKLRVDPRITPIGRFLRQTSLDELPQLWNILRGEMSLVGPRPIVAAETRRYGRYFSHYCRVKPGLTGLWQVSGRSNVSYQRRVAMDVLFIRRKSLRLYLHILAATLPAVIFKKGAV